MKNAKVAAPEYLFTMLLQKMENDSLGTIAGMIDGVKNDQKSTSVDGQDADHVAAIFEESLALLYRATA